MSAASFREIRIRIPVWTWGGWWSAETVKELRALGPAWLFTLFVPGMIACVENRTSALESFSMVAFVLGCAVMGALSFGHEFSHRTLSLHLSQPVSRRHLWWSKMRVLGSALASVTVVWIVSQAVFSGASVQEWGMGWRVPLPVMVLALTAAILGVGGMARWWSARVCIWGGVAMMAGVGVILLVPSFGVATYSDLGQIAAIGGQIAAMGGVAIGVAFFFFCAAPFYTLLTRSTLAGAVFSLVITMAILVLASAGTAAWMRSHPGFMVEGWGTMTASETSDLLIQICWSVGMVLFCLFALVVGRRRFIRMEAIEPRGGELALPRWLTARLGGVARGLPQAPSGNLVRLIRKELGMHHVSLLLAGLLVVLWGVGVVLRMAGLDLSKEAEFWWVPFLVYAVLVPLLCGAVACAEERSMGMLEWQLTLPASCRRQWLIKGLVALGLALVLVGVLPLVLLFGWCAWGDLDVLKGVTLSGVAMSWGLLLMLTSLVLYASSFARNAMKAALWGVVFWWPFGIVLGWGFKVIRDLAPAAFPQDGRYLVPALGVQWLPWIVGAIGVCVVFGFLALLLRLGYSNYRRVDVSRAQLAGHLAITLGAFAVVVILVVAFLSTVTARFG